jgi:peptidyl-prolyl cis-trans isomerase SurA
VSKAGSRLFRWTRASRVLAASVLGAALFAFPAPAEGAIIERVVAVIGERPVLLSELRHRARPLVARIASQASNPAQAAAMENEAFRELLNRMIDERLEEQQADRARLVITPEEIDAGIRQVAQQANVAPKDLLSEARRSGLTEQDYRDEIRRQVLEGKLLNLRVRNRVRVTDADARASYDTFVRETGQQQLVDLKLLILDILPGSNQQDIQARVTLGDDLAQRARKGEDFCELVKQYSTQPQLKNNCGSNGPLPLQRLPAELQTVAKALKAGEVSDPISFRDPSGQQAVLVVKMGTDAVRLPEFEQVKDQMMERAFLDALERQKREWLKELRRGVYIEVRL